MGCTVVVVARRIEFLEHGYDLRVANLCRQLGAELHLVVVPVAYDADRVAERTIEVNRIFESVVDIGNHDLLGASPLRHLRLSEQHYWRRAYPRFFSRAVGVLRQTMARTAADRLIVFGSNLAGIAAAAGTRRVLFDVCDSHSLTLRREFEFKARSSGGNGTFAARLALRRWRACEGLLPRLFAQVTTINEADSEEIRRAARPVPDNVHTVPNGVGEKLLNRPAEPPVPPLNGVAFWGSLDFAPNREALRWFLSEVYVPHLEASGIEVAIIGRGAEPWLMETAGRYPNVKLVGFVDDLAAAIRRYPVMINPMVIGSGMKNKVLEAFAARCAVVSTALGMESIAGASAGVHHLVADRPGDFAHAVLRLLAAPQERQPLVERAARLVAERYSWSAVGASWRSLHDRLDEPPRACAHPTKASIA